MTHVILRLWSSRIRTSDEAEYAQYVTTTGLSDYATTPGNLGAQILMRTLSDGVTQVTTVSWWESMDAIRAFAGAEPDVARYYPEDDRYLLDKPRNVEHHWVVGRIRLKL